MAQAGRTRVSCEIREIKNRSSDFSSDVESPLYSGESVSASGSPVILEGFTLALITQAGHASPAERNAGRKLKRIRSPQFHRSRR
jgi:hypothetical protein